MTIKNGQLANEQNLNNAFVSKTDNSTITGELYLNKTGDGASVVKSAQKRIFDLEAFQSSTGVNVLRTVNPAATDDIDEGHKVGAIWHNSVNNKYFFCTSNTADAATWTEIKTGGGGGGSSLKWEKLGAISPANESQDGINLESFSHQDEQEIYLTASVPEDFVPAQILLFGGSFFTPATTGKVLFQVQTTLIRPETTVMGTYANTHTSTNAEVTVNAVANTLTQIGNIDLTDVNGAINGQTVQEGDILRIKLFRKISSESVTADDSARVLINNFGIKFS